MKQAELNKVQDKDVTDAIQSAKGRKRNVEARLKALQQTVLMFEKMKV
jgi:valyl-tRNA synthetase